MTITRKREKKTFSIIVYYNKTINNYPNIPTINLFLIYKVMYWQHTNMAHNSLSIQYISLGSIKIHSIIFIQLFIFDCEATNKSYCLTDSLLIVLATI